MKDFQGKVAVITGAASGIGRALAEKSAQEGMKVVLADVEAGALKQAEVELKASGADVLAVLTDVSQAADVERLAEQAFATYGAVHLLCNNAGVSAERTIWKSTLADWQWVLGVNLWGVIHGIHYFVPRMLAQESEGHIVNTASMAGFLSSSGMGIYKVSKFGVVTLSETLAHELAARDAKVKASVLCPEWVNTHIMEAGRNRPSALQNAPREGQRVPKKSALEETVTKAIQAGIAPSQVAEIVFEAVRQEKFYIFTHPNTKRVIEERINGVLEERLPRDYFRADQEADQ